MKLINSVEHSALATGWQQISKRSSSTHFNIGAWHRDTTRRWQSTTWSSSFRSNIVQWQLDAKTWGLKLLNTLQHSSLAQHRNPNKTRFNCLRVRGQALMCLPTELIVLFSEHYMGKLHTLPTELFIGSRTCLSLRSVAGKGNLVESGQWATTPAPVPRAPRPPSCILLPQDKLHYRRR